MKSVFKFFLGFLIIAGLGAAGIFLLRYLGERGSEEYKVRQELEKINRAYEEDPYGGDTPEETLRLFIDALKAGDMELASKYFVLDKQEEWRNDLLIIKERGLLENMISELESTRLTKESAERAFFTLIDENNLAVAEMIIARNPLNHRWKITEL